MAHQPNTVRAPELALVDRPEDLALEVPTEAAPGADEVDAAALSLAVDEGWDPPDMYDDYTADPRRDYADSVGMPLYERIR